MHNLGLLQPKDFRKYCVFLVPVCFKFTFVCEQCIYVLHLESIYTISYCAKSKTSWVVIKLLLPCSLSLSLSLGWQLSHVLNFLLQLVIYYVMLHVVVCVFPCTLLSMTSVLALQWKIIILIGKGHMCMYKTMTPEMLGDLYSSN